jgi:hypothetical protein
VASRIAGGGSRTLYAEDARRDAERRYGPGAYYEAGNGGGRSSGHWYDGVVSAFHGAMNWIGDLTGFDNGSFSLGNVGLSGSNAAAANEAWDGVITVTAPARQAVDDFFAGWNATPVLPYREASVSASPAYIPVVSEWQYRQGYAGYTASLADGMSGQRSIFNSPFENFGLDARAAMYNIESAFQRPAALLAPIDASFGRGMEAISPHYMTRYRASEGLATAASVMVGNPEALAATMGPRAITAAPIRAGLVRTNGELVQSIATRAEAWGVREGLGNGPVAGTLKHGYAERLLNRYQGIYGDRGLTAEVRYINGVPWQPGDGLAGSIRLDVVEGPLTNPIAIYDYKFGGAVLTPGRVGEIQVGAGLQPNVPILAVRP